MTKIYYKLQQKFITNYCKSYFCKIQNYYKLRQVLLEITAGITNCDVITNYVAAINIFILYVNVRALYIYITYIKYIH